jgi:hypothetical protein
LRLAASQVGETNIAPTQINLSFSEDLTMASDADLRDSNVWDDTALIDSWDEAVAEYKVSPDVLSWSTKLDILPTNGSFFTNFE